MRVVQVTPYFPPSKGGIARYVSGLVEHIETDAQVHVLTREGNPSDSVSVLPIGKGRFIFKALQLLKELHPDVIHCHSHWHMLAPAVVYKRFHKEVEVLFTFHTEPMSLERGAKGNIFGRLLKRCDAVTYVSKSLQDQISNRISIQTKERVVYPGVRGADVSDIEVKDFKQRYGVERREPILVFVGLLEWEKKVQGVKVLLEAVAEIRKKHPNLALFIVGDGSRREEVEEVITSLDLSDNATITGLVDDSYVPLSLCDVYVHISLQEGLPQALLEAMSLGKPVIASNIGGIPEAIVDGENGILVEPRKDSVSSAIENLLEDRPRLDELGREAKRHVETHFTWEETAKDFLELYSSS